MTLRVSISLFVCATFAGVFGLCGVAPAAAPSILGPIAGVTSASSNNVLFSVLAQYFGPDAINDRLLLIETMGFTTTQQDMLDSLTRIISDRSVGEIFFGSYHLMDYELMGGDGRAAIIAEDARRGIKPVGAASGAVRLA